MNSVQKGVIEARFADKIWQNEPLTSMKFAKLREHGRNYKKPVVWIVIAVIVVASVTGVLFLSNRPMNTDGGGLA